MKKLLGLFLCVSALSSCGDNIHESYVDARRDLDPDPGDYMLPGQGQTAGESPDARVFYDARPAPLDAPVIPRDAGCIRDSGR